MLVSTKAPKHGVAVSRPARVVAPIWRRALAYVIDVVLLTVAEAPLFFMAIRHHHPWGYIGAGVTASLYNIVGVALWGRTAGKLAMGIQVVSPNTQGAPGWRRAVARILVPAAGALAGLTPFTHPAQDVWALAVYATALTNPRRQGLHDLAAGTMVIESQRGNAFR